MRRKKIGGSLWFAFGVCAVIAIVGLLNGGWDATTWIVWGVIFIGLIAAAIYTEHQVIPSDDGKTGHTVQLWDNTNKRCIHGVKLDARTLECAWPFAHPPDCPEPTAEERKKHITLA